MGWDDVLTFILMLAFVWACDWATGGARWRSRVMIAAGLGMYVMGSLNGADAAKKLAARDAAQSAILADRNMPR